MSLEGLCEIIVYISAYTAFTSSLPFGLQLFCLLASLPITPLILLWQKYQEIPFATPNKCILPSFSLLELNEAFSFLAVHSQDCSFFDTVLFRLFSDCSFLPGFFSYSYPSAFSFFLWFVINFMYSHSFSFLAHSCAHQMMPVCAMHCATAESEKD